jgi:hypothetical protein
VADQLALNDVVPHAPHLLLVAQHPGVISLNLPSRSGIPYCVNWSAVTPGEILDLLGLGLQSVLLNDEIVHQLAPSPWA